MKITASLFPGILRIALPVFILFVTNGCRNTGNNVREYGWFDFVIPDTDSLSNDIDMSFLNESVAGASGFVTVKDGHFIDGKGERIRFFGTNLTFGSCFPDRETAVKIAARLRKLGMNVVRFHHMDNQSAPNGIWDKDRKNLDPGQLEKLDWLIYQLKIHGIYTNINTHVSYTYPGMDYKDIEQFNYGKAIDNFYRPYIEMQKVYAEKLLKHVNIYTGNAYSEEPAVAFVEINNENSLLSNWALLPRLNSAHMKNLITQWQLWLRSNPEYSKKEGYNNDLIDIIANYGTKATSTAKEMMWAFLMNTEISYAKEMSEFLRNKLRVRALISESQASYSGAAGILREAESSDYIDMHAYWEHPSFPGRSWSPTDWLIRNTSMVSDRKGGTLLSFDQHRVKGMPLTISEYDHPAPSFFCAEMFPMINSISAFQDFDGIYHFTFNQPFDEGRINNFFSSAGHPLKQVFVPAGAVLFRMGAVQPGRQTISLNMPPGAVLGELVESGGELRLHGSNMRSVWKKYGAHESLIALHRMDVNMEASNPGLSESVSEPAGPWESDTGEIIWDNNDSSNAVFKVKTPSARVAAGYIGGKAVELGSITVEMDATPFNWATVTITSLDGKPLEVSSRILLSAAGRAENTDMKWNEGKTTVGSGWGEAPTKVEGIPARLVFRDMDRFRVHSLDPAGNRVTEVPVLKRGRNQSFDIDAGYRTLWYIIVR
ncbi:MAG TPA: hypothetical protein PKL65_00410 [Bacteroidales bacterium]|nr:hypothetical protein [Bacteroidales bacterium]HNR40666.1 hypothetical protein [Bacteroidales bacterium]